MTLISMMASIDAGFTAVASAKCCKGLMGLSPDVKDSIGAWHEGWPVLA